MTVTKIELPKPRCGFGRGEGCRAVRNVGVSDLAVVERVMSAYIF